MVSVPAGRRRWQREARRCGVHRRAVPRSWPARELRARPSRTSAGRSACRPVVWPEALLGSPAGRFTRQFQLRSCCAVAKVLLAAGRAFTTEQARAACRPHRWVVASHAQAPSLPLPRPRSRRRPGNAAARKHAEPLVTRSWRTRGHRMRRGTTSTTTRLGPQMSAGELAARPPVAAEPARLQANGSATNPALLLVKRSMPHVSGCRQRRRNPARVLSNRTPRPVHRQPAAGPHLSRRRLSIAHLSQRPDARGNVERAHRAPRPARSPNDSPHLQAPG